MVCENAPPASIIKATSCFIDNSLHPRLYSPMKHLRFLMFTGLKSDIIIEPLFWHAMKNSLLALFFAAPLFAQFDPAEVLGTVRDNSGSVVPKATINLVNQGTGIQARTTTGDDG